MNETFPMRFVDGHIIVSMNTFDYIVDTGSSASFGHGDHIIINEKHFSLSKNDPSGITIDSLNSLSGLQVHGLIGMDILIRFDIKFTENQMIFSDTPTSNDPTSIRLPIVEMILGVPIINLNIEGKTRRIFFDTGAKISYISEDLLVRKSIGKMDDFHPLIGKYQTSIYHVNVKINEQAHQLTFGTLPSVLKMLLIMGRTEGIIGTELFQKYNITISNLTKSLVLEPKS